MAKRKAGQPTKYKPEYCSILIEHMAKGYSFESFAGVLEVSQNTLYSWVRKFPEFEEAKDIAFSKCQIHWETLLEKGIWSQSGDGAVNLNSTLWIFNMKNRFKWRDRQKDEIDTQVHVNQVNESSKADIESLKQELLMLVKK